VNKIKDMPALIAAIEDSAHVKDARRISGRIKPSRPWQHLVKQATRLAPAPGTGKVGPMEEWGNALYGVTIRRFECGWPFGDGPWAQIGIYCHDGQPRHDWRDMQHIKNDVLGDEWEAVELFPAESRLIDPSNYYTLYAAPGISLGIYEGRRLVSENKAIAPQRPWHASDAPKDAL
jgi:hypothetical protein